MHFQNPGTRRRQAGSGARFRGRRRALERSGREAWERLSAGSVVAFSKVLSEGVASDYNRGGAMTLEAAHLSEPGPQSPVVGLDAVTGVLGGVVMDVREQLDDRRANTRGLVGGHLGGSAMISDCRSEEPGCCLYVRALGHPRVDDVPVLIQRLGTRTARSRPPSRRSHPRTTCPRLRDGVARRRR